MHSLISSGGKKKVKEKKKIYKNTWLILMQQKERERGEEEEKKERKKRKKRLPRHTLETSAELRRSMDFGTWRQLNPSVLMDLHRNDDLAWKSIRGETSRPPDHTFS